MSRALIKTTPSEFCTWPSMRRKASSVITSRNRSNMSGSTIALETPVSSSRLIKTNPLAVPGR